MHGARRCFSQAGETGQICRLMCLADRRSVREGDMRDSGCIGECMLEMFHVISSWTLSMPFPLSRPRGKQSPLAMFGLKLHPSVVEFGIKETLNHLLAWNLNLTSAHVTSKARDLPCLRFCKLSARVDFYSLKKIAVLFRDLLIRRGL